MDIAIWGAGAFGKYIIEQLQSSKQVHIRFVIDSHAKGSVAGIDIISPSEYSEIRNETDYVLVAFLAGFSIKSQITEAGISKWGVINRCVYLSKLTLESNLLLDRNIVWNTDKEMELPAMETLETNVVDYCNLNCRGCSHFSNLFEKGAQVPYEVFERDIRFLADKIYIEQFNLLGGEVFLNVKILDYVDCLQKNMPKTYIVVVTNGLLIPKLNPAILKGMAVRHVEISITEYPPTTKVKEQIRSVLEQYGIRYSFRNAVTTFGKNIDVGGTNNADTAQLKCRESKCQFLRYGKIYKCPFSALGNYFFDHYGIPLHFEEGVDIYADGIKWEETISKLREMPIEMCRYCGKEERFAWQVSTCPEKEEWLI